MSDSTNNADFISMEDFIFGTLATDELRLAEIIKVRSGLAHERYNHPRNPLPEDEVQLDVTAGPTAPVIAAFVHYTTDGLQPSPDRGTTLQLEQLDPTWDTLLWSYLDRFIGFIPRQAEGTIVRYLISGITADGRRLWVGEPRLFSYAVDRYQVPTWMQDACIYHIFMDRFAADADKQLTDPGSLSGFYGGTFNGILNRLDYISALGVNTLWLSPIFPSPSHHGYDWTDLREINPRYGTKADFKALMEELTRRNIRVILDYVPNHNSNEHPYFQAAQTDANSPYRDYYNFTKWPDEYESFFGVKSLPQLNHANPAVRQYLIDCTTYWMTEFGVSGFRLDYALGPSHDFWTDYYTAVKRANPDSVHLGEIVETPATLRSYEGVLDGALDFLWLQSARKLFAYGSMDVAAFEQFLSRHEGYFAGASFSLPTFLDNHDMNRFLWVTRNDPRRLKQAAACQFSLGGPPIIYYGTEVGLSQQRDVRQGSLGILEESRLPMPWGDEQDGDLLSFYQRLIQLRNRSVALRRGDRTPLIAEAATGRLGYLRTAGDEQIAALFNVADKPQAFALPAGKWVDALSGAALPDQLMLDAYGVVLAERR